MIHIRRRLVEYMLPPFFLASPPSASTSAGSSQSSQPVLPPFPLPQAYVPYPAMRPMPPQRNFDDDEEISVQAIVRAPAVSEGKSECLTLSMKCGMAPVSISPSQSQEIPCAVLLVGESRSLEAVENERPGTDIVCVIDISGSMSGMKIEMVRNSLQFIVENSTAKDRMSLVVFDDQAERLCPLIVCNEEGRARLQQCVSRLAARGSTNVQDGLRTGLKVLQDRKVVNQVACLFLLSDGHDTCGGGAYERCRGAFDAALPAIAGGLALHTFGFGTDHDAHLMSSLAESGRGSFQYVEDTALINTAFAATFGGVVSVVARNVEVRLSVDPACEAQCSISRLYSRTNSGYFSLPSVTANECKYLIFLLSFSSAEVLNAMSVTPVRGTVKYEMIDGTSAQQEVELKVEVVPAGAPEGEKDADVYSNWYRVKATEVLSAAQSFADHSDFSSARDALNAAIAELSTSAFAAHPMVQRMQQDLQACLMRVNDQHSYHQGGAAQFSSLSSNHYYQTSSISTLSYSSPQQVSYTIRSQTLQTCPARIAPAVGTEATDPQESVARTLPPPNPLGMAYPSNPPQGPPQFGAPSGPPKFGPSGPPGPPKFGPSGPLKFGPPGPPKFGLPGGSPKFGSPGGPSKFGFSGGSPKFAPSGGPPSGPPKFGLPAGPPGSAPTSNPLGQPKLGPSGGVPTSTYPIIGPPSSPPSSPKADSSDAH